MADLPPDDLDDIPRADVAPRARLPLQMVWLIPLVAVLVGGGLAIKSILERGTIITISFKSGEGLEPGKTVLKFKDVNVGIVKAVALSPDLSTVVVTAEVGRDAAPHLVEDTRFWIVRPRISGGVVSGIGTLLSGSYIALDFGRSGEPRTAFVGLETPPVVRIDSPGREFILHGDDIGSLEAGSPIVFRRLRVGQLMGYRLDPDGKAVTLRIFVNEPYDEYVTPNTRFWNSSGIDVTLDASGLRVDTQSLAAIIAGGIAFETPADAAGQAPAPPRTEFQLFPDRVTALKNPEPEVDQYLMSFNESTRGLEPGAPVDLRGIVIGEVTAVGLDINAHAGRLHVTAEVSIYPDRLRVGADGQEDGARAAARSDAEQQAFIDALVARGLRGQLRTANLLTGQRYIAMDFFANAPPATVDWSSAPPQIPTTPGSLEELQSAFALIARKIDKFPAEQVASDLRQALQDASRLLQHLDRDVAPAARDTLAAARATLDNANRAIARVEDALDDADRALAGDSDLQRDARAAMRELARAAEAVRVLAEYLDRHPEALLRGKPGDAR